MLLVDPWERKRNRERTEARTKRRTEWKRDRKTERQRDRKTEYIERRGEERTNIILKTMS